VGKRPRNTNFRERGNIMNQTTQQTEQSSPKDIQTPSPFVQPDGTFKHINPATNPSDLGVVAAINYRLFQSSPVRTKRFDLAKPEDLQKMQDFIETNRAKVELQNERWVLVDKGTVDHMVISYVDTNQLAYEKSRATPTTSNK